MSLDFTDDESTLVQVMAWCHQATSHYLSQCWPRYMSPYGVTRPQWVKAKFGMFFVIVNSDAWSASVTIVPRAKSYDIGPRYYGTWLYSSIRPHAHFNEIVIWLTWYSGAILLVFNFTSWWFGINSFSIHHIIFFCCHEQSGDFTCLTIHQSLPCFLPMPPVHHSLGTVDAFMYLLNCQTSSENTLTYTSLNLKPQIHRHWSVWASSVKSTSGVQSILYLSSFWKIHLCIHVFMYLVLTSWNLWPWCILERIVLEGILTHCITNSL